MTAYSSLYEIGKPKKGETLFVSSAAGAVGSMVGQLAKREGLRVIGSVGDDDKLRFIVDELGFDGGFNYKKEKPGDAVPRGRAPGRAAGVGGAGDAGRRRAHGLQRRQLLRGRRRRGLPARRHRPGGRAHLLTRQLISSSMRV